jgi:hypothetical protein
MTVARVVFIARYRVPHACMSMQFDHMLDGIDRTVIASPVPKAELWPIFARYGIDTAHFDYLPDEEVLPHYPEIENWVIPGDYRGFWLRQQAVKLSVLDYLKDDVVLLTDPDTFMTKPYCCYNDGRLNYLVLTNTTHGSYNGMMDAIVGIPRQSPHCFITEFVPVHRDDWNSLKTHLEQRHTTHFLDAIIDSCPGLPTVPPWGTGNMIKWFSEYELLGNWAVSQHAVDYQEQRRFEYNSLDKLGNFTADYNCFADAVPDLSLSLQLDWSTGIIKDFEHHLEVVQQCLQ